MNYSRQMLCSWTEFLASLPATGQHTRTEAWCGRRSHREKIAGEKQNRAQPSGRESAQQQFDRAENDRGAADGGAGAADNPGLFMDRVAACSGYVGR
jgi:hypothetical protein